MATRCTPPPLRDSACLRRALNQMISTPNEVVSAPNHGICTPNQVISLCLSVKGAVCQVYLGFGVKGSACKA